MYVTMPLFATLPTFFQFEDSVSFLQASTCMIVRLLRPTPAPAVARRLSSVRNTFFLSFFVNKSQLQITYMYMSVRIIVTAFKKFVHNFKTEYIMIIYDNDYQS